MNKIVIGIIVFVVFSFITYWMKFSLPLSFKYSDDFDLNKTVHTFDISLKDGSYRLGFYIGKEDIQKKKNDGEYILEYYCDDELIKKTKNLNLEIDGDILHDRFNLHTLIIIDKLNIPNDFTCNQFKLQITTIKNFSLFDELDLSKFVKFYIRDSKKEEEFFNNMVKEQKIFRKKYPRDFIYVEIDYLNDDNLTRLLLMKALFQKDLKRFRSILNEYNLNIDVEIGKDKRSVSTKRTPLIYASYFNDLPTVKYLLENGANINHEDFIRKTALQYAIENNATKVVKYLLEKDADKNLACFVHKSKTWYDKLTPLTYAIKNEFYELTKILLENGFRKIDLDKNCKGIDISGQDNPIFNVMAKDKKNKQDKSKVSSENNPFVKDKQIHIYQYLFHMQYPVRFLKLFEKYGLKDEKYERYYTEEWFKKHYEKCQTGIYGGRCSYILDNNISLEEYNIYKFFEITGYQNRNKNNKRNK